MRKFKKEIQFRFICSNGSNKIQFFNKRNQERREKKVWTNATAFRAEEFFVEIECEQNTMVCVCVFFGTEYHNNSTVQKIIS